MSENYCVMTMAKRHRNDVRGLQAEANREYDDPKKYKNNVDLSKSHENVFFAKSDDWQKSIDEVLEANGIQENRNSVVLITSVYSVSPGWFETHTEDEAMEYFRTCFEYEKQTKGEVINCVLHKDESTWHMQVATVPITLVQDVKCTPKTVKDKQGNPVLDDNGRPIIDTYKKGKSKGKPIYERKPVVDDQGRPVYHTGLNAKVIFGNRIAMSKRQTHFFENCGKQFGMSRGEIRVEDDEVAKERLSEAEYKAGKIVEKAEEQAEEARKKAEEVAKGLKQLEDGRKALEASVERFRASQRAFERQKQESIAEVEKARTEAQRELEAYRTTKRQEIDREVEIEKQAKLESFKMAIGDAYAAQMDYQSATRAYNTMMEGLPERIIQNLNRLMIKSGGKSVPVGDFYAKYIKSAVESASMVDSETVYTEQTAKKNMSRAEQAESQFSSLNEKMKQRSGEDYGYSK